MTPISIRLASSADDIAMVAPLFDAYRVFYRQPSDLDASQRFLLERWRQRETVLFFAVAGGNAAGFVHLFPSFVSDRMRRLWILNDLFVAAPFRRAGVAKALMQRAEQHARDTGAVGLTLSTAVNNVSAQQLYRLQLYEKDEAFFVFNRSFE